MWLLQPPSLATLQGPTGTPDVTVNNVTAGVITATFYSGDGSQLTGRGVGIQSGGTLVAYGATIVNFVGSGASVRDLGSNTVEVLVSGGGGGVYWYSLTH